MEPSADPFGPWIPLELAATHALFAPAPFTWWIAGGHALDLFVGHTTRAHHDIDVSILRADAPLLRHLLLGWDLQLAHAGVLTPWTTSTVEPPFSSIWCRTSADKPWCLQVMFDEGTPTQWTCRRHPEIVLPMTEAIRRSSDVPYLAPHIQLIMKAKDTRDKDDADFATVLPLLSPDESRWLTTALRRHYPNHRWLG
jgi:hypothetical protein